MAENGRQDRVALYLAAGLTVRRAAQKAGVGERTIFRWLQESEFGLRVQDLRTRLLDRAVGRLSRAAGKAATTLNGLLESTDAKVKLAAAKAILETGLKVRQALEPRQAHQQMHHDGGTTTLTMTERVRRVQAIIATALEQQPAAAGQLPARPALVDARGAQDGSGAPD